MTAEQESFLEGYLLLDSGDGEKLERFGEVILRRPSSLCIWKQRHPEWWDNARARFVPKEGWKIIGEPLETWISPFSSFSLELRLQTNGQVGMFPEHSAAISIIQEFIGNVQEKSQKSCTVLNLFAYTGLLSVISALYGATVTHVDSSKSALDWASKNISLNSIEPSLIRFIKEDALSFMEREVRRGKKYDVVICDPPSFSRISKTETWDLEEKIHPLMDAVSKLVENDHGLVLFSSHHSGLDSNVIGNLLQGILQDRSPEIMRTPLIIPEESAERILPAGHLAVAKW